VSHVSEVVGGPLVGIEEFESRGSTVHTHYDGREIQRTFYLKPANMAPAVVGAMQGSVAVTEEGVVHRLFPARDPDYPECYCNEVKVNDVDPRAIAHSDSLQLSFPVLDDLEPPNRHERFMVNLNRIPDSPAGGCFLTASYRPLITGWQPTDEFLLSSSTDQRFDWITPHFTPTVRTVPWPDGLQIGTSQTDPTLFTPTVPDEVAQPLNIPVIEFTVKRLLVDKPRFDLLNRLLNHVNLGLWPTPWPKTSFGRYEGIPQFPSGTLRFDSYEVIEHASPFPASPVWYELVYHFSWICIKTSPVYNEHGALSGANGYDNVTWNHVFMRPMIPHISIINKLVPGKLGWYFVMKAKRVDWTIGATQVRGPLYHSSDFDPLFMLNPPIAP